VSRPKLIEFGDLQGREDESSLFSCQSKFRHFDRTKSCPTPLVTLLLSIMPPKEKQKASGSAEKKSAPTSAPPKPAKEEAKEGRISKPDQAAYQTEQDALKKEIDEITAKLVCPCRFLCQRTAEGLLTLCTPTVECCQGED
jgi:hypothetical protein